MAGGLTKGKSHAKGGIKMKVKSTGQNIEVEGGEGIINKYVMSDGKKYSYEGKDMTACEIASDLNQKTGNGVSFDCDETKNTDMTPTDPSTGFAKGGKTKKRKYKKMAKKGNKGAFAKLVSKIMKRDGIPYKQAQKKAKDEYVSGTQKKKGEKKTKKSYKGRMETLKGKSKIKKIARELSKGSKVHKKQSEALAKASSKHQKQSEQLEKITSKMAKGGKTDFYEYSIIVDKEDANDFRDYLASKGFKFDSYDEAERYDYIQFGVTTPQMTIIAQDTPEYVVEITEYAKGGKIDWKSESPKIYVASLYDYNAGRLEGEWIDFADYNDGDEVVDAIKDMLMELDEKYDDGEEREEWAIHDHENTYGIIEQYSGERDFDKVYAIKDAVESTGLPFSVLTQRINDTGQEIDEVGDDYYGAYDSEEDFADQFKDESGMSAESASYYVYCDEITADQVAQEEADRIAYDYDDDDILQMADMEYEYEEADDDDKEDIIDRAREKVNEEVYDEWYRGLVDDAVDWLVNEQGIYSEEDVVNLNWLSFDLDRWTRDLMYDFTSYYNEEDGMYYIFNN